MIALMVCSLFSAWSKTIRGRRLEHLVGHLEAVGEPVGLRRCPDPRWCSRLWNGGRQCMNFTWGFSVRASTSGVDLVEGLSRSIRSFQTLLSSPIETHTSV